MTCKSAKWETPAWAIAESLKIAFGGCACAKRFQQGGKRLCEVHAAIADALVAAVAERTQTYEDTRRTLVATTAKTYEEVVKLRAQLAVRDAALREAVTLLRQWRGQRSSGESDPLDSATIRFCEKHAALLATLGEGKG